eukprot:149727-Chlamydomonas_euryale.AAC.3
MAHGPHAMATVVATVPPNSALLALCAVVSTVSLILPSLYASSCTSLHPPLAHPAPSSTPVPRPPELLVICRWCVQKSRQVWRRLRRRRARTLCRARCARQTSAVMSWRGCRCGCGALSGVAWCVGCSVPWCGVAWRGGRGGVWQRVASYGVVWRPAWSSEAWPGN